MAFYDGPEMTDVERQIALYKFMGRPKDIKPAQYLSGEALLSVVDYIETIIPVVGAKPLSVGTFLRSGHYHCRIKGKNIQIIGYSDSSVVRAIFIAVSFFADKYSIYSRLEHS